MTYIKGYKFRAFMGIFFKFIEAVFELLLPFLMVVLIDKGIGFNDLNLIHKLVIIMGIMSILGYLSSVTCQYNASIVSQGVGGKLRTALMQKINSFSLTELDLIGPSTLVNRMIVDINQVQLMVAMTIRLAVRTPILMVGSIFALYQINVEIAKRLLMFFPLFLIVIVFFMWLSLVFYRKMQKQLDILIKKIMEYLEGMRIVRAFSRVKDETQTIDILNQTLGKRMKVVGFVTTLSSPFTMLLMNVAMLVLIYQGSFFVQQGTMTQGQMVAIISYCTQLVLALVIFMNLVMIYSRGLSASSRLKEVLNMNPVIYSKKNAIKELDKDITIRFENVSFSYPNEKRKVLSHLSFIIKPGTMVGFIGLTGSGKSTILNLLMRYYDVDEGEIFLNDVNIKDIDLVTLRNTIGFATQTPGFIEATLYENVSMGREGDVEKALKMAEGNEILDKGLTSIIQNGGSNLSGGQKQRMNIARALSGDPSILILDDSLSALDYLTDKNLRKNLLDNYKNMTSIVITQRTTSLVDAHTIYVLKDGHLEDAGTHQSLLQTNELYKKIHATQARSDIDA